MGRFMDAEGTEQVWSGYCVTSESGLFPCMATGWASVEVYFDSLHCVSAGQVEERMSMRGKRTEVRYCWCGYVCGCRIPEPIAKMAPGPTRLSSFLRTEGPEQVLLAFPRGKPQKKEIRAYLSLQFLNTSKNICVFCRSYRP